MMKSLLMAAFFFATPQDVETTHSAQTQQKERAGEAAPIDAARFLVGRWVGTGFGGDMEEVWSPPQGGQMVGHTTFSLDGTPRWYEIIFIRPTETGALEMVVRHFNFDFTSWEDKGEWTTFAAYEGGHAPYDLQFQRLRVERQGEDALTTTVTGKDKDGNEKEYPIVMKRVK